MHMFVLILVKSTQGEIHAENLAGVIGVYIALGMLLEFNI